MLSAHTIFSAPLQCRITRLASNEIFELSRVALQSRAEAFSEHFAEDDLESFYDARYRQGVADELADNKIHYYVYKVNDKIIGFAKLMMLDDGLAKLDKLYFLQNYHRQGFGSELLKHCEAVARENHCDKLLLHAYHGNPKALAFYRALGFVQQEGLVDFTEPATGEVYKNSNVVFVKNIHAMIDRLVI